MILSGQTIRRLGIITPFTERTEVFGFTYGLSPAGYDVRVEFDPEGAIESKFIEPGDFRLCSTIERFKMPDNVLGVCHDKSSWARRGLAVQNTVAEPGWEGYLTLELTNHSKRAIRLLRGTPIAQIVFHFLDEPAEKPYGARDKYQKQERGPQVAR